MIEILNTKSIENGWVVTVQIHDKESTTEHRVAVDRDYLRLLESGANSAESLVRRSFVFLLERESKESILRSFNLRDISRYFPEYEEEISKT